jgi:hypothetical protein
MKAALTKHDAILRDAIESNHGLCWLLGSSALVYWKKLYLFHTYEKEEMLEWLSHSQPIWFYSVAI